MVQSWPHRGSKLGPIMGPWGAQTKFSNILTRDVATVDIYKYTSMWLLFIYTSIPPHGCRNQHAKTFARCICVVG
jgi:hypothetical protein